MAEQGEKAVGLLNAAMMVSVCFEPFKGTESLEKKGLNLMLNRHLANCLVESVKEAHHHFVHSKLWDLDHVYKSKTVKEFDERFTCHQFGYTCVRYYLVSFLFFKLYEYDSKIVNLTYLQRLLHPYKNQRKNQSNQGSSDCTQRGR